MSEAIKVLRPVKTADRLESIAYEMRMLTQNKIGLKVAEYSKDDLKKLADLMAKNKKPAEFCMSIDVDLLRYFARVGNDRISKDFNPKDSAKFFTYGIDEVDKRNEILDALYNYGVLDSSHLAAIKNHPIKV